MDFVQAVAMPPWLGKVVEAVYDTKPLENRDPFKI